MALAIAGLFVAFSGASMAMDSLDPDDARLDDDRDGLINLLEYGHGTDPTNPDTDCGGCDDGWEVYWDQNRAYWDPNSADPKVKALWQAYARYDSNRDGQYDVNVDPAYKFDPTNKLDELDGDDPDTVDSDHWNNLMEFQRGTDPTNPDTDGDMRIDDVDPQPLIPDVGPGPGHGRTSCEEALAPSSQGAGQSAHLGASWESY